MNISYDIFHSHINRILQHILWSDSHGSDYGNSIYLAQSIEQRRCPIYTFLYYRSGDGCVISYSVVTNDWSAAS